ncbi:MAG: hypothetical protein R2737_01730 [Candidatus Nanopelagicales bacterium]
MTPDLVTHLVGAVTTALAVAFAVPQLLRLRRTGTAAGVSVPSIGNSLVSCVAWTAYGVSLGDVWVTATSVAGLPALGATFVLALRSGASRRGLWLPVAWAALLAAAAVAAPLVPALFPALLGFSVLWYALPAVLTAWTSRDVAGIAPGTWWLLALDGSLGGLYGLLADVPANLWYAGVALSASGLVLLRLAWRRTRACGVCAPVPGCRCDVALAA